MNETQTIHDQHTHLEEPNQRAAQKKKPKHRPQVRKSNSTSLLDDLLSYAMLNRAELISIQAGRLQCSAFMRIDGTSIDIDEYTPPDTNDILQSLRGRLAGQLDDDQCCNEALLDLQDRQRNARSLVTIENGHDQTEVQLYFPSHLSLMQKPLITIGGKFRNALNSVPPVLTGNETGALFISSSDQMTSWQLLMSILMQHAMEGNPVHHLGWKFSTNIPNVQESIASNENELLKILEATQDSDETSLLSLQHISSDEVLSRFSHTLNKGRSLLSSLVEPTKKSAQDKITKAFSGITEQSKVIHLHAYRLPKLCSNCLELREEIPKDLPEWANAIDEMEFHEAEGCEECGGRGHKGIQ